MMAMLMLAAQPRGADPEFRATIELLLFALGGAMTLGVVGFLVWLVRQMLKEDRETREREAREAREGSGGDRA
jgi:ABC-type nickel/cobalt efflux system permease component RcnA